MPEYSIVDMPLDSITPYEFNNKVHTKGQVDKLVNSMKEFGVQQNIVVDENGIIIVGHCRYEAAKKLKMENFPCKVVSDWSEAKKKKYRIMDNRVNESSWDRDNLKVELEDLDDDDLFTEFEDFELFDPVDEDIDIDDSNEDPIQDDDEMKEIGIYMNQLDYKECQKILKKLQKLDAYIGNTVLEAIKEFYEQAKDEIDG